MADDGRSGGTDGVAREATLPPLYGVRIIDLTMVWAGPYATRLLADAGADVIKIEGVTRPDSIRTSGAMALGGVERPFDRVAYFNEYNRNKRGLALDLSRPEGRAALLRLVRVADALIENFRAGVLEGWGLGPERLLAERPDLVIVSMPGFAKRGSERDLAGYGPTIEQLGGLIQLTGYPGDGPEKSGISYGDPIAGTMAAGAMIAALLRRRRTGQGAVVEVSQRDNMLNMIGEAVLDYCMNRRLPERRGNRHRWMAPHGCYPSLPLPEAEGRPLGRAGQPTGVATDRWVTIAVATDAQWQALCRVIGRPDLAEDPRYAQALGRYERQDELDAIIANWTRQRSDDEAMTLLQAAGVPAAAVRTPLAQTRDPHLAERGFYREIEHPVAGRYRVAGPLWNVSSPRPEIVRPAPVFGQHRVEVLGDLAGYDAEALAELEREQVIGDEPVKRPATPAANDAAATASPREATGGRR
ncbi:MAG TPA: CoA transferase [Dehalococcoidia bacterium]|nr:CoA transferase [Dehalococcoidia bacterium]